MFRQYTGGGLTVDTSQRLSVQRQSDETAFPFADNFAQYPEYQGCVSAGNPPQSGSKPHAGHGAVFSSRSVFPAAILLSDLQTRRGISSSCRKCKKACTNQRAGFQVVFFGDCFLKKASRVDVSGVGPLSLQVVGRGWPCLVFGLSWPLFQILSTFIG